MQALVVYESMYGNTHVVASDIAAALQPAFEVTVVPVKDATQELVNACDLLVCGAPLTLTACQAPQRGEPPSTPPTSPAAASRSTTLPTDQGCEIGSTASPI